MSIEPSLIAEDAAGYGKLRNLLGKSDATLVAMEATAAASSWPGPECSRT